MENELREKVLMVRKGILLVREAHSESSLVTMSSYDILLKYSVYYL